MPKIILNVTLILQGPILTQSSTPGEYGLDAAMARKPDGTPYLPGTLILGRLRQSWAELSEAAPDDFTTDIATYLGDVSPSGSNDPKRKVIQCSDFVAINTDRKGSTSRIRIDDERGSVATGAYLVIDSPFAPGEKVDFKGTINYLIPDGTKDELQNAIETGLRWITSFGGQRTVGFGRLLNVTVTPAPAVLIAKVSIPDDSPTHLRLLIKPHDPFCIAKRQIDENLFESEEIIPGGSIKGALASTWGMLVSNKSPNEEINATFDDQRKELSAAFETIRFSHAFPCQRGRNRPVKAPLSLVKDQKESKVDDVALKNDVELINDESPKFAVDWKESGDVSRRFGWPQLARELRVRTKMDRVNRRSDKGKLFAYEMIEPDGHDWEGVIDLSRIGDAKTRKKVIMQLIDLLSHGLNSWGKTKTGADTWITGHPGFSDVSPLIDNCEKYYKITLQTPVLLCDPDLNGLNETSGQTELFNAYSTIWKELSDNSLELTRFFATQSLAGGNYLHNRFQPKKSYYPWLLTDAGSTFVLKVKNDAEAKKAVTTWLKQGLPLPESATKQYERNIDGKTIPGNYWKCCPYIPENGYGEIAVNINLNNFPAESKEGTDE